MAWEKGQTGLQRQKRDRPIAGIIQSALEQRLTPRRMERMSKTLGIPISDEMTHDQLLAEIILAMVFDGKVELGDGVLIALEDPKDYLDWVRMIANHIDGPVQTVAVDNTTNNNFNFSLQDWQVVRGKALELAQNNMAIFGEVVELPATSYDTDDS